MQFIDFMSIVGFFLRLLGALVFGVAAGWLVLQSLKPETYHWPLALGVILGLFGTFALIAHWVDGGGTLGAFGLGAGAAILIWPLVSRSDSGAKAAPPTRKR
jgi:peptidoglycan/LPS O-acetylase OafA/YrhL